MNNEYRKTEALFLLVEAVDKANENITNSLNGIAGQVQVIHEELAYIKKETLDDTKEYVCRIGEGVENFIAEIRMIDVKNRTKD